MTYKIQKFISFMTKVKPSNGNETKSDIFSWDIFKSNTISFYQKILKYFNDFQNSNISVLLTKVNPNNGIKTNQTFLCGAYSNLTLLFIGHKMLKYFNDFYNWNFLINVFVKVNTIK